jgi:hypothetical protein
MKKNFREQLKAYSAVAASIAATSAGAQVVYTDVNPDAVIFDSTTAYFLDLNGDSIADFLFAAGNNVGSSYQLDYAAVINEGDNMTAVLGSSQYGNAAPYSLNAGDSITPASTTWFDTLNGGGNLLGVIISTSSGSFSIGNWIGVNDKYVGLRVHANGQFYYGWARLGVVPTSDTIILKEYAYQVMPNVGITAGQTVGIATHAAPAGTRVHAYQQTAFVNVAKPEDGGVIEIYDMTGKLVSTQEITSGETVIDLSGQPLGIYMIHVRQGDNVYAQKVYIK